jgi:RNase P subunit RPR2
MKTNTAKKTVVHKLSLKHFNASGTKVPVCSKDGAPLKTKTHFHREWAGTTCTHCRRALAKAVTSGALVKAAFA